MNEAKARELRDWLRKQTAFKAVGPTLVAGYDPPWTIPFLRLNEVMIEVTADSLWEAGN